MVNKRFSVLTVWILAALCVLAQPDTTTIKVTVSSSNLSEDLTIASSKSDELILLIYEFSDESEELNKPTLVRNFNLREGKMETSFDWKTANGISQNYLLFLIEVDSDKSDLQIDPILRIHHRRIIERFENRDYLGIEKYLGDEDLLGYRKFSVPSTHQLRGVYKLDKFDYSITFSKDIN